ncbi:hypothetical protein KKA23_03070 [Patescibacteria group bacterium]|nr:hypothetical protein [Patescibacteria group bacterium]
MILTPHILIGSLIGSKTKKPFLIIILGILSHIFLDYIQHWDYDISGIVNPSSDFKYFLICLLKIFLDVFIGFLIVFFISNKKGYLNKKHLPFIAFGIIFAVFPDLILFVLYMFNLQTIFEQYLLFHQKFLHTRAYSGFGFWGVFNQIIASMIFISAFFIKIKKRTKTSSFSKIK